MNSMIVIVLLPLGFLTFLAVFSGTPLVAALPAGVFFMIAKSWWGLKSDVGRGGNDYLGGDGDPMGY